MNPEFHGLMKVFAEADQLVNAARQVHAAGYRFLDAYSPFPIEELPEAIGLPRSLLPAFVFLGGACGAAGGYFMQWYAMAVDYPLNVGGRPLHTWPAFVPITFELTVLSASLFALIGWLIANRLPRPHHPVFNIPEFERSTTDQFFLCVESRDPLFQLDRTRQFLERLGPGPVWEVPA